MPGYDPTVTDVLLAAGVIGLLVCAVSTYLAVRSARAAARKGRQVLAVRTLSVTGRVSRLAAARRDLARDVLQARRAFDLARKQGRPVKELAGVVRGLERIGRSLDADLRLGHPVGTEVARTREAAQAVVDACRPVLHGADLDDLADTAERARLVAEAHRQLSR